MSSDIHSVLAGETWRMFGTVAKASGDAITSGTVNYYIKCLTGDNAGKWWKNADQTWAVAETANAMSHQADGNWTIELAASPFTAGVLYLEYAKESGDLHVAAEGRLLRGQAVVDAVSLAQILGTALTETSAGYLAAALKKLLDVETPVLTAASVNQTIDNPTAAAIVTALLTDLLSSADFNTASSFGKLVKDNLNATITSRHASGAAVAKSPATLDWSADVSNKPTIGTSTLTQAEVTGGAYDMTNVLCLVHLAASQHVIVDSGTVTTLTNLPAITTGWLTAAGIAASALSGKGDWLLASGYTSPPSASTIASQVASNLQTAHGSGDWTTGTGTSTLTTADIDARLDAWGKTGFSLVAAYDAAKAAASDSALTSAVSQIVGGGGDTLGSLSGQIDGLSSAVQITTEGNITYITSDGT